MGLVERYYVLYRGMGALQTLKFALRIFWMAPSWLLIIPDYLGLQPPSTPQPGCGHKTKSHSRIVGGENARQGDWPWQASFHWMNRHWCGGTLINEEWVMSAAHCFHNEDPNQYYVKLGKGTLSTKIRRTKNSLDKDLFSLLTIQILSDKVYKNSATNERSYFQPSLRGERLELFFQYSYNFDSTEITWQYRFN